MGDGRLYKKREKVHPKKVDGPFRRFKWAVLFLTLGIYYITPWLRWDRGPFSPDQAVLVDLASGAVLATMPTPGYLVVMDAQDNIYAATTISNNSSDAQVIYRRARDGTQFEPVVTNVQYLNSMATDDAGNLYLHQRHAIVKVEFTQ